MASASISTSISGEMSVVDFDHLVAGRIMPKNSPCARPTFSQSLMLVKYMRVRTTSRKACAGLRQRGFDIANRLHRLQVGVAHADNFSVWAGGGGTGNVDHRADAHRARVADDRLPGRAARIISAAAAWLFPRAYFTPSPSIRRRTDAAVATRQYPRAPWRCAATPC